MVPIMSSPPVYGLKLVRAPSLVLLSPFLFLFFRGTPLKPEKSNAA